jgi:hypothetical protein
MLFPTQLDFYEHHISGDHQNLDGGNARIHSTSQLLYPMRRDIYHPAGHDELSFSPEFSTSYHKGWDLVLLVYFT